MGPRCVCAGCQVMRTHDAQERLGGMCAVKFTHMMDLPALHQSRTSTRRSRVFFTALFVCQAVFIIHLSCRDKVVCLSKRVQIFLKKWKYTCHNVFSVVTCGSFLLMYKFPFQSLL